MLLKFMLISAKKFHLVLFENPDRLTMAQTIGEPITFNGSVSRILWLKNRIFDFQKCFFKS